MKKVLLLAGLAGMVAANAQAFDATPYVGADATFALVHRDNVASRLVKNNNWSLAGVLGARTDHFGIEAFYNQGLRTVKNRSRTRNTSYGVDLLAFQQLGCSGRWELVGSAGIAEYKLRGHNEAGPGALTDRGIGERLGAGVQYALTDNTSVRAMYHHNWVHNSVVNGFDEFTIGIRYAF